MNPTRNQSELRAAARQEQFLDVIDRDEAVARFQRHLNLQPLGTETVALDAALNRILATEILAPVDVPGFDRANVDGFAVQAANTFGAMDETPRRLVLNDELLSPGVVPNIAVRSGTATAMATGGMVPRGADAVVMVEHTETEASEEQLWLEVRRAVTPGQNISFAGTDIARGETILRGGQVLTSREIGVLAALGLAEVTVFRRPRVAILSTGDEIIAPGQPLRPGAVYDSNAAILAAAVRELGGEPVPLGVIPDDEAQLQDALHRGLQFDMVLLSGGTSKGAGDLSYRVVSRLTNPGIVAHGVALKPGKPICLAVTNGTPVVVLPGFPTSAVFTFHEFVAPVIRRWAGGPSPRQEQVEATLPVRVNSERGRTEFLLVGLVHGELGLTAYPMGKGSGSVTTFSLADGFVTIPAQTEILEAGRRVAVQLLGQHLQPADLTVITSHCVGLDALLTELQHRGVTVKAMHVGSTAALAAAKRGACDVAGIHLLDPQTGRYNEPFLTPDLELIPGYRRMQGLVFRPGDSRFEGRSVEDAVAHALADPECRLINRNAGAGTRILIDQLLKGVQPPGYAVQAKSHNAVATAIQQGRADWGVAIEHVARQYGLGFLPLQDEHFDFVVPRSRLQRPAVQQFRELLTEPAMQQRLRQFGFRIEQSSSPQRR